MTYKIDVEMSEVEVTDHYVNDLLNGYQESLGYIRSKKKVRYAFQARNQNQTLGGIVCNIADETMHIELLAIEKDAHHNNVGIKLLEAVMDLAKSHDLISVTVSTLDFQALDFYLKYGFEVFASIKDVPFKGVMKHYLIQYLK